MKLKTLALTLGIAALAATTVVSATIAYKANTAEGNSQQPQVVQTVTGAGKMSKPQKEGTPATAQVPPSTTDPSIPQVIVQQPAIPEGPAPSAPTPFPSPYPEPWQPQPATPVPPTPSPTPAPPVVQVVLPSITNVSPAGAAIGVAVKPKISVTFSREMDKASAQQAFYIVSPAANNIGNFTWDATGKVMTFVPANDFTHGVEVKWQVAKTAKDTMGLALAADFSSSFRVVRTKTVTLVSQPSLDGSVKLIAPGNGTVNSASPGMLVGDAYRGFVSFDLSLLPSDLAKITGASLSIYEGSADADAYSAKTGKLMAQSVTYGAALDATDWAMAANQFCFPGCVSLQSVLGTAAGDGWKTADVHGIVNADWNLKAERGSRSQFRLQFEKIDPAPGETKAMFHTSSSPETAKHPVLKVTIEYP